MSIFVGVATEYYGERCVTQYIQKAVYRATWRDQPQGPHAVLYHAQILSKKLPSSWLV